MLEDQRTGRYDLGLSTLLVYLYFVLWFDCPGEIVDRVRHLTHRFDTFWLPPHFFIFAMTALTSLVTAAIAFTPRLRIWFGPSLRVPLIPFLFPGSLVILGTGLIALSCTIMFDNFWHSTLGLMRLSGRLRTTC